MKLRKAFLLILSLLFSGQLIAKTDSLNYSIEYKLIKPVSNKIADYSGDKQTQTALLKTEKPIRVLVLNREGKPQQNVSILFKEISIPSKAEGFSIADTLVETDS